MKKRIAKKWVAALRSGDYKQQKGSLADLHRDSHCCLGVLCELAILNGVDLDTYDEVPGFDDERAYLPFRVQDWAGVRDRGGSFPRGDYRISLMAMNDDGYSFSRIANAIETEWEKL